MVDHYGHLIFCQFFEKEGSVTKIFQKVNWVLKNGHFWLDKKCPKTKS